MTFVESKVYGDFLGANKRENLDDSLVSYKDCNFKNLANEIKTPKPVQAESQLKTSANERPLTEKIDNEDLRVEIEMTDKERLQTAKLTAAHKPITGRTRSSKKQRGTQTMLLITKWNAKNMMIKRT